ncbi:glycosyltransferase [Mumia zhuanghuii]|uniref:Glycosyltransferase n=1 Tax=Mumia zhuanghuii TaxID=2585211 RepID=A0A5C4MGY5_9ACTN|nr:glycosyltransferase [Mumia zhuanghuii]TNC42279.1 glycosyltransferase [Mumia zhuanghuii]TNC46347.1 glycosyltransferase [Mumia zhuanghuii]
MRLLIWHVHGSWTTSFVQGRHEYLVPVNTARDADGRGRARTWDWPASVREVTQDDLAHERLDAVVLQRPHEPELVRTWTGLEVGVDVPAVYVEHNTPPGDAVRTRHPRADLPGVPVVHVTPFNQAYWDCGSTPTYVVEHGIVDPGHRYSGEWPRAAVVMNEPVRRTRVLGTDLLPVVADAVPLDVFGMGVAPLASEAWADGRLWAFDDLPQDIMHTEVARRRVYLHTARWTSLGLSLLEAMHLGLPAVAFAGTEAPRAIGDAGVVSADPRVLRDAAARFIREPMLAEEVGAAGRGRVRARYGLERFLADWDALLDDVVAA